MSYASGGGEIAESHLERLFTTKQINGVQCRINAASGSSWGLPLNPGWYGIPDGNPKFGVCAARIGVEDFLRIQGATRDLSQEEFEAGAYNETVEKAKESIESGDAASIPTPVLEIEWDEYVVDDQEGRSRAVGAKLAGLEMMPVWVAAREYK